MEQVDLANTQVAGSEVKVDRNGEEVTLRPKRLGVGVTYPDC